MVERRKKSGKEMKVTMDEFWKECEETREIKYGKDIHFEKNLDYCRHFGEISVLHKGDEWNLKNIVKYCYYCMITLNGMTREVKKEDFDIYKWTDERTVKREKLLKEYISKENYQTMKDFLKQVLLIWMVQILRKQTFKEPKQRCGRVSNMKPQEIINNGGK